MSLADAVGLLRVVYASADNGTRRDATMQLLQWEKALPGPNAVQIGLGLLQSPTDGVAVQAYGAVLLRHALHARQIRSSDLPMMELLTWYCNEPTLGRLLLGDLTELMIEAVVHSPATEVEQVLDTLCTDAETQPRRTLLLSAMVVALLRPDFDRVPRDSIGLLKRAVGNRGRLLLRAATMSLYAAFMAAGGEGSTTLSGEAESCVEAAFQLIAVVAPTVAFAVWQEHNLPATLEVLLRWGPAQRYAIACATELLRSYDTREPEKAVMLRVLLGLVLSKTEGLVATRDIAGLDDVLALLLDLPRDFTQLEGVLLARSVLVIFNVPSIQFAQQVMQLLERLDDATLSQVDPVMVYEGVRQLLPKNLCHPSTGSNEEGRELSREQFGFDRLFEDVFADFRRSTSTVLCTVAKIFPDRTNQYQVALLSELPSPAGTAADPRTGAGFVRQSSPTFVMWETTQFMMESLSTAFARSSVDVNACVSALLAREPTDAVLRPVYFNMLSYFWKTQDDPALQVWDGTLTILFSCITEESTRQSDDIDVVAARRRAHTLLVQLCVEHSTRFRPLIHGVMAKLEPLLVRAGGMEKSLLYEALIALTAVLTPEDSDAYLQKTVNPLVAMLAASRALTSQAAFNAVFCAISIEDRDARDVVQGCVNTLAAVFRRCQMTTYVVEKATQLFPLIGRLLLFIHNMQPNELPREFRGIAEQATGEKEMYLPGHQRRSEAHLTGPVRAARGILMNARIAVYQIFGALTPVLPAEQFSEVLNALTNSVELSTHVIRSLSERCLLPMAKGHSSLLPHVCQLLARFFSQYQQSQQQKSQSSSPNASTSTRDDVAESKQWMYYAKDILTFLRGQVLDTQAWQATPQLLRMVAELAIGIFDSGADTRGTERFLLSLVSMNAEVTTGPAAAEATAVATEVRQRVYARLLQHVMHAPVEELPPAARDQLAYNISEPYVRLFPALGPALTMAGLSTEQQETLNAHLVIVSNFAGQRRKVKDFLLSVAAANGIPS